MGVRKNQATLTADEKQRFVNTLLALKANGTYDLFVRQHRDAMNGPTMPAHGMSAFLPWHREFLRRLERELQRIDPGVSLPYWDWTVSRVPGAAPWTPDLMGGTGDASGRVTSGPFAFSRGNWPLSVTGQGDPGPALRRRLGQTSSLPRPSDVASTLGVTPYDRAPWMGRTGAFRGELEHFVHDPVHNWVGGSMQTATSPNDPVFFMHHANVDRLWANWQLQHRDQARYLPNAGGPQGSNLNDPMSPWGIATTPASVVDHLALGYSYDTDPPVGTAIVDLTVGAPPAQAMIARAGEIDTYRFVVPQAGEYTIETTGPTDVIMSLFGPNDANALVTQDDDSGQDRNARIAGSLSAGTYLVTVRHFDPRSTGSYGMSVARNAPATIAQIAVNGPPVQANIAAADESDLYTFVAPATDIYIVETSGITDTFLTLFGPNSQTRLIAQDDDSGLGLSSRLEADLAAGAYFVRVRHFNPAGTGAYTVTVTRA